MSDATSVRSDASRTQISDANSLSLTGFSAVRTQIGDIYRYMRKQGGSMYGVIHMQRIGGDRENGDFASSLGMTGIFASDNGQFASDACGGLGFCVRSPQTHASARSEDPYVACRPADHRSAGRHAWHQPLGAHPRQSVKCSCCQHLDRRLPSPRVRCLRLHAQ